MLYCKGCGTPCVCLTDDGYCPGCDPDCGSFTAMDSTGALLRPGDPEGCQGNGADACYEICCDECDYFLTCYPEFDIEKERLMKETKKELTLFIEEGTLTKEELLDLDFDPQFFDEEEDDAASEEP